MDSLTLQTLIADLRRDEGVRSMPYLDTEGVRTVGVGHNCQTKPLPNAWTYPLTDVQISYLLSDDIANMLEDLDHALPWWLNLNNERQLVLANMAFNLGITKLLLFRKALLAMRRGDYGEAADEMLNSKWAAQVKGRATRLAQKMRTGQ